MLPRIKRKGAAQALKTTIVMRTTIITFFWLSVICCGVDNEQKIPTDTIDDPIVELTNLLENQPNDLIYLKQRGSLYLERGLYVKAILDLKRAYEQEPEVVTGHMLSDAYLDAQESRSALELLQDVVEKHPMSLQSKLKLSEFQFICKQYAKAHETLQSVRRQDPENAESFFMDGLIYEEKGAEGQALSSYQQATKSNPELLDAWIHAGQILDRRGDPDAERYFAAALTIQPDHIPTLHAQAISQAAHDQTLNAKKIYKKIILLAPDYTDAYFNLGLLYLDQDSLAPAHAHFDLAVKTRPQFANGYFYRGLASEFMANLESALLDYEVTRRLDPTHERAAAALARVTPPPSK